MIHSLIALIYFSSLTDSACKSLFGIEATFGSIENGSQLLLSTDLGNAVFFCGGIPEEKVLENYITENLARVRFDHGLGKLQNCGDFGRQQAPSCTSIYFGNISFVSLQKEYVYIVIDINAINYSDSCRRLIDDRVLPLYRSVRKFSVLTGDLVVENFLTFK